MKKLALVLGASALLLASASSAFAHEGRNDYTKCAQSVNNARLAGGFLGAGAGAAIGKAIAASQVRPEGIVLGAVVGAVVGGKIGKDSVACDDHYYSQGRGRSYGDHYYNGHRPVGHNGGNVYYNQAPAPQGYYGNSNTGWYQPSPYGYYGSGVQVVNGQGYYQDQVQVQQYSTGWQYVPAPQYAAPVQYIPQAEYVPAPQYVPAPPVQYAPQPGACGQWVCQ